MEDVTFGIRGAVASPDVKRQTSRVKRQMSHVPFPTVA